MMDMLKQNGTLPIPFATFGFMDFVLDTRTATVQDNPCGFKEPACVLEVAGDDPGSKVGKSRGPFLYVDVPRNLQDTVKCWKLSFDVSAGRIMQMGDVHGSSRGGSIFSLTFYGDGKIHQDPTADMGKIDICPYRPNQPIHFDILLNNETRTVAETIDHDKGSVLTFDWMEARSRTTPFAKLVVTGMTTGPHNGTGKLAITNIRLESADAAQQKENNQ